MNITWRHDMVFYCTVLLYGVFLLSRGCYMLLNIYI